MCYQYFKRCDDVCTLLAPLDQLMTVLATIRGETKRRIEKPHMSDGELLTGKLDKLIKRNLSEYTIIMPRP